ncbi:enoyl-CoA hydratase [Salinispirillum marinum]|uniref:Enoyl-CoA hydratase n=2 Tax=Saccharospirillaceae TaxID=255527 RepID=A0ABV8BFF3_9GAMM
MSMSDVLTLLDNGVMVIRFNRPDKKNAITEAMYDMLRESLEQAETDAEIKAVLFTGDAACFTAGNDLRDFMAHPMKDRNAPVLRFLRTAAVFPKPMVAAVNGSAIGIGTTLLLHCDLVVAGEQAVFQMPFVNLGLVPEFASSLLLPRQVGHVKAAEWLLLGNRFSAQEALAAGLINKVVADTDTLEAGRSWAQELAKRPPEAMQAAKRLMKGEGYAEVLKSIDAEAEIFQERLRSKEFATAVASFFQR